MPEIICTLFHHVQWVVDPDKTPRVSVANQHRSCSSRGLRLFPTADLTYAPRTLLDGMRYQQLVITTSLRTGKSPFLIHISLISAIIMYNSIYHLKLGHTIRSYLKSPEGKS